MVECVFTMSIKWFNQFTKWAHRVLQWCVFNASSPISTIHTHLYANSKGKHAKLARCVYHIDGQSVAKPLLCMRMVPYVCYLSVCRFNMKIFNVAELVFICSAVRFTRLLYELSSSFCLGPTTVTVREPFNCKPILYGRMIRWCMIKYQEYRYYFTNNRFQSIMQRQRQQQMREKKKRQSSEPILWPQQRSMKENKPKKKDRKQNLHTLYTAATTGPAIEAQKVGLFNFLNQLLEINPILKCFVYCCDIGIRRIRNRMCPTFPVASFRFNNDKSWTFSKKPANFNFSIKNFSSTTHFPSLPAIRCRKFSYSPNWISIGNDAKLVWIFVISQEIQEIFFLDSINIEIASFLQGYTWA